MANTPEEVIRRTLFSLPQWWGYSCIRVIHCLPDDTCDGWRVTLLKGNEARIEVLHRVQHMAYAVALEAAGELYPEEFPEWAVKRQK